MGWWRAGEDGSSLHTEETGMLWGDWPADIMDQAVEAIVQAFLRDVGRYPTKAELESGFKFATHSLEYAISRIEADNLTLEEAEKQLEALNNIPPENWAADYLEANKDRPAREVAEALLYGKKASSGS